jgi:predicted enzyme related to lactoylglutathione lyase
MAEMLRTYHVIAVPDLEASAKFYADVMGFEIHEVGDPGWRMFVNGAWRIMAGECPDALPAEQTGDHSYFAYFVIEGIDQYIEEVKAAGAQIIKALHDEPWNMREFAVKSVDGHRIMVGQQIDTGRNRDA